MNFPAAGSTERGSAEMAQPGRLARRAKRFRHPQGGCARQYRYDSLGNRRTAGATGAGSATAGVGDDDYTVNALNQYVARENNKVAVAGTAAPNAAVSVATASSTSRKDRAFGAEVAPANASGPVLAPATVSAALAGAGPGGSDLVRTDQRTQLVPARAQAFVYDADGNLTADGLWLYTYDAENRLVRMTSALPAGFGSSLGHVRLRLDFKYDYQGRRIEKKVVNLDTSVETLARRFLYEGWNLIAELTVSPLSSDVSMVRSYTWGLDGRGNLRATSSPGALLQLTAYANGAPSGNYYPGYDQQGNVISLTRASDGFLAAVYEYDPFGNLVRSEAPDPAVADNAFRHATKYRDAESGLIYYGHRYYAPTLGRFVNQDPIGETGGLNLYGFAGNAGVNGGDTLGLMFGDDALEKSSFRPILPPGPLGPPSNNITPYYDGRYFGGEGINTSDLIIQDYQNRYAPSGSGSNSPTDGDQPPPEVDVTTPGPPGPGPGGGGGGGGGTGDGTGGTGTNTGTDGGTTNIGGTGGGNNNTGNTTGGGGGTTSNVGIVNPGAGQGPTGAWDGLYHGPAADTVTISEKNTGADKTSTGSTTVQDASTNPGKNADTPGSNVDLSDSGGDATTADGLPADAQPAANWSLYRYIYTGNGRAPDNVYDAAVTAAADFIVNDAGVRGVYLGAGIADKNPGKESLGTAAGLTGMLTIDNGATASIDVGFGLQERGRSANGQFTSQTIGVGGSYQFWSSQGGFVGPDQGAQFSGIYGGGANRQGGGNFGYDTAGQTFMLGLNRGPVYGGIVIDVNRMSQNIADSIRIISGGKP